MAWDDVGYPGRGWGERIAKIAEIAKKCQLKN
jgi:hypothetical protein